MHTGDLTDKMLDLWTKFEGGKISGPDARTHIGFSRVLIDIKKVEIMMKNLNHVTLPTVQIDNRPPVKVLTARRRNGRAARVVHQ